MRIQKQRETALRNEKQKTCKRLKQLVERALKGYANGRYMVVVKTQYTEIEHRRILCKVINYMLPNGMRAYSKAHSDGIRITFVEKYDGS